MGKGDGYRGTWETRPAWLDPLLERATAAGITAEATTREIRAALDDISGYAARVLQGELRRAAGFPSGYQASRGPKKRPIDVAGTEAGDDGRGGARYEQSPETGDYRFWLPGQPGALILSSDQVREILWQYSAEGDGLTQKQVAAAHGMTRRTLSGILKALRIVKGDLPYTDEEAAERDPEELADELAARMRARIDSRAHRQKWKALEADARRWRSLELSVLQYVQAAVDAAAAMPPITPRKVAPAPRRYAALIALTDLHIGKGSWGMPGAYSITECRRRLSRAIDRILARLQGGPELLILPIGGDLFQSDSSTGTTARGTPQDHDLGGPERMITEGIALAFALVRELASVAPVRLVHQRGNHDPSLSLALFAALEQAHKDDPRIILPDDDHRYAPYQAIRYGASLLGFAHGDGRHKPADLSALMSQRWPAEWAATRFREWHTGHRHHVKAEESHGVTVMVNPSLSGADRYHALHWPIEARPQLAAHVYDRERGRVATIYGVIDD